MNRDKMTPAEVTAYRNGHNGADPPDNRLTDKVFTRARDLANTPYFLGGTLKGRSFFEEIEVIFDGVRKNNCVFIAS